MFFHKPVIAAHEIPERRKGDKMSQHDKQVLYGVISALFLICVGVIGVLYSNITKAIDSKADRIVVDMMQEDVHAVRSDISDLIDMHLQEGYTRPSRKKNGK